MKKVILGESPNPMQYKVEAKIQQFHKRLVVFFRDQFVMEFVFGDSFIPKPGSPHAVWFWTWIDPWIAIGEIDFGFSMVSSIRILP